MKLFDHPNIVFLVGACTQDQIVIVTELCKRGSLFDCMHKARVLFSQRSLWRIMREIAVGPSTATVCCWNSIAVRVVEQQLRPGIDPQRVPQSVAKLMTNCWAHDTASRPEFPAVIDMCDQLKDDLVSEDLPMC
mmetsp:Transcript_8208/g.19524  ORF Transcript_8208/g.19524 Transcript_8208/m.19524 type:complete len:134 (-) Transcript_8208:292-693(-)